jgi:glycosyltransferase involved in cell wall biosynthesis
MGGDRVIRASVIICAHNPRPHYLTRVLNALRDQSLSKSDWELLLIDNCSSQPLVMTYDLSWHPGARHILEKRLGLTQARLAGIRRAEAGLIIFVDDDNVLQPNYLENALRIAEAFPQMGAFGGAITGEFETPVPDWAEPYLEGLCIKDLTRDIWSNVYGWSDANPYGAGMCVRRVVAQTYERKCAEQLMNAELDRVGNRLTSAGDLDLAWTALDLGFGVGRFRDLRLLHLIPKERLSEDYLIRLHAGFSYSNTILWFGRGITKGKPTSDWRGNLRHVFACIRLRGVRRRMYFACRKAASDAWSLLEANGVLTRPDSGLR